MQANAYNESEKLREMYANLVAKSMNADFHDKVHPAYVEIIKQLSPAEAVFLEEPGLLLQATPIHAQQKPLPPLHGGEGHLPLSMESNHRYSRYISIHATMWRHEKQKWQG